MGAVMWLNWKNEDTDFEWPLSFDDKVSIFYERIWGWQLHVAELCLNGGQSHDSKSSVNQIPHSEFAALQIMLAYFEMIAKYEAGYNPPSPRRERSAEYFKRGVNSVFPALASQHHSDVDLFLEDFYRKEPSGLFHMSQTAVGILLTTGSAAMQYDPLKQVLLIDPYKLPGILKSHLVEYCNLLKDPANMDLRENFRKCFDHDNAV
jgi:hypothetical protein